MKEYSITANKIACFLGILIFGISVICLGSILPQVIEKYGLTAIQAGTLATILPLGILIGSLLFGLPADAFGFKWVLFFSSVMVAIGSLLFSNADSILTLNLAIFLIGAGGGSLNGATSALIADISSGDKGASLSLLGVFFGIGALGTPILFAVLNKSLSFESIIFYIGISMAIASAYFLFISYPTPKQEKKLPLSQAFGLLKDSFLLLFAFLLALQSGIESLLNNWSNSYILEKGLGNSEEALYALSISMIALTLSRLLMSKVLNLYSSRMVLWFSLMTMGMGIFLFHSAESINMVRVSMAMIGFGIGPVFPISLGFVGEKYADLSATAFSLVFSIALGGNMLINYFMGWWAAQRSIEALPYLEGSVVITMIFLFYLIDFKMFRKQRS